MEKQSDAICMSRVAIDLYSQQIGVCLEDVSSFVRYLGGSPGNVVYGMVCQGPRSSMLARVGDEHTGRFLCEELNQVGCDTSHLIADKDRLTTLVPLGIRDRNTLLLIFYRDSCADTTTTASDVDEQYTVSTRRLAITGMYLSHPQTRRAVLTALACARRYGVRTALDIDHRPVSWGFASLGDGETRFIAADQVIRQLQGVLHLFDVTVGIKEEFHIADGGTDTLQALSQVRGASHATLVRKRDVLGCSVYTNATPTRLDDGLAVTDVCVEVLNVLGAGDTFMSGLLCGYLNDEGQEQMCRHANVCDALVVSRHGCASAMPSKVELDDYLSHVAEVPRLDPDPYLNHLHRVTTRRRTWPELCVVAFDHRSQLEDMAL